MRCAGRGRTWAMVCAAAGVLLLLAAPLWAAEDAAKPQTLSLMAGWRVQRAAEAKELGGKFFAPDFDDSAWEKADIVEREDPYKDRFVFYRRWVEIPADWKGKKISLSFGAVDDDAVVYLNGRKVGAHKGYSDEFEIDITAAAKPGDKNLVAVLADNSGGGGCGIWKPVSVGLAEELAKSKAARDAEREAEARKLLNLASIRHRVVYESFQDTNWEIMIVNADGSNPVNLTRTPDVNELYPHVSPDGRKICFVVDVMEKEKPVRRDLYYMNMVGTGRTKVAENAREGCWNADGTAIAYLKGEFPNRFVYDDYANRELVIYDLKTGTHTPHPNQKLHHLYNLCWSADGNWFVATVHGGMGFGHAILAIEAKGTRVFNLGIPGCRPDLSPDGKRIAWGAGDFELCVADFDTSSGTAKIANRRTVIRSPQPMEAYHVDWSPDGRYVAFSRGPRLRGLGHAPEIIGIRARGWNICVADANATNVYVQIITDDKCNKEPDWAFVADLRER